MKMVLTFSVQHEPCSKFRIFLTHSPYISNEELHFDSKLLHIFQ